MHSHNEISTFKVFQEICKHYVSNKMEGICINHPEFSDTVAEIKVVEARPATFHWCSNHKGWWVHTK